MSSLCLCLTAKTCEAALAQFERYRKYIDMIEVRLDLIDPSERKKAAEIPLIAGIPAILTIRLPQDGGSWGLSGETEPERLSVFAEFIESGNWAYVDLEYNRPLENICETARDSGTRIIRSRHDFEGSLLNKPVSELAGMIRGMAEDGSIPKLALRCEGSRQLLTLARTALSVESQSEKILLGMGEFGAPSRILADRFGSTWTYASALDESPSAAPGQVDPETLQTQYRFSSIGSSTPLYGVTGDPIAHSQSPMLHNKWLKRANLPGTYIPIRSDDIAALVETCDIWGLRGLSVTVPHKKKALGLCDYSGHLARRIGAANTLLRAGDGWRARNTDAEGFLKPLPGAMGLNSVEELKGKRALIVGAGGAARAAVHVLTDMGMKLIILNRTVDKAQRLGEETGNIWGPLTSEALGLLAGGIDLIVQTTTVGMHPNTDADPIPWWKPGDCTLVYDMIYEPGETLLLSRARSAGIRTMNGSGMLEEQARLQFKLFTGVQAPD